jgi:cell division septation protein DedD
MRRTLRVFAVAGGVALSVPGAALHGQSELERVERLTRMGQTEEARAALLAWWEDGRADASRRELQRGLWLRGRLTVDPVQAELDFRRLAVLYPSGQFTPDAILRLAQASYAMGDDEEARRFVETLVRDYPRSEAREAAEDWLADAGPVPPPGDTPTRASPEAAAADTEAPGRAEERREDPPPGDPPVERRAEVEDNPPSTEPTTNYYVQLGAFAEEERAVALYEEVRERGIDVRVVRVEGSRFTHVRVGRFANREDAVSLLEDLTAEGVGAALVRDDRVERPVRD